MDFVLVARAATHLSIQTASGGVRHGNGAEQKGASSGEIDGATSN